ncbi:MAG: metallopeptidase family protein [Tissierellia bacterium]|nr:metallopeptidase family protein [Tissierellia bacterium]
MNSKPRFEEIAQILDQLIEEIPEIYLRGLNGGIILSEEILYHPQGKNQDLLIMGQYQVSPLGRMIVLYYGSIYARHRFTPHQALVEALRDLLHHELTHHLERLAGENDLALEDMRQIEDYQASRKEENE